MAMGFWRGVRDVLVGRYDSDPVSVSATGDQLPQLLSRLWGSTAMGAPVSREIALEVPAVARHHRMVAESIATLPLREIDYETEAVRRSQFLDQIDPDVANVVTLAQTIEDLIFDSISWWLVTDVGPDGYPASARRLAPGVVHLQPRRGNDRTPAPLPGGIDPRDQDIYIEGHLASAEEVRNLIRFDSPGPPLLVTAARTLRRSLLLDSLAETYADNPRPLDYLSAREGADTLDDDEIVDLLDKWIDNRRRRATGYLPWALEYNSVDQPTPADLQLVPLQRQVNLDLANHLGLDPEDLGASTTSRTYQNGVDRRKDRVNDTLSGYMVAIAQRLSMRDVTQPGRRVEWDLDGYLRADPATRATYLKTMRELGAITAEEINRRERLGPMPSAADRAALTPQRADASFAADDGAFVVDFAAAPAVAVDVERRTIRGLIMPWNKIAVKNGQRFMFRPGSLTWTDMARVKHLRDHVQSQAVGVLFEAENRTDGLYGALRVATGRAGDELLALAAEGVYDGLSAGVEFEAATDARRVNGVWEVYRSLLREVSSVALPAFDDARATSVAASRDQKGATMPCTTCGQIHDEGVACPTPPTDPAPAAAPEPITQPLAAAFSADQLAALRGLLGDPAPAAAPPSRGVVNPARPAPMTAQVRESLPYRMSLARDPSGQNGWRYVFDLGPNGHDFSTDLFTVIGGGRDAAEAEQRVNALIRAQFDVDRADTAALSPTVQRPDLWQPQMDFATPLWDMINSGSTDGRAFALPKFNSSSGLVVPAVEGTEPAPGSFVVTDQTITPTQVWGKVEITRQAARRTGSPQLSGIIWEQMLREYYEDREAAVATFLGTLTAAADIALPAGTGTNQAAVGRALEAAIATLKFVRGGNRFRAFAVHQDLYEDLAGAADTTGRPLYPIINPTNANGTAASLFDTMNIAGTTAVGSWALGAGGQTASTNSWLFDPAKVRGWASTPERLDWNFGATVQSSNIPQLAHVTIGIYGDVALANLDINGVRQVTYDPVA